MVRTAMFIREGKDQIDRVLGDGRALLALRCMASPQGVLKGRIRGSRKLSMKIALIGIQALRHSPRQYANGKRRSPERIWREINIIVGPDAKLPIYFPALLVGRDSLDAGVLGRAQTKVQRQPVKSVQKLGAALQGLFLSQALRCWVHS